MLFHFAAPATGWCQSPTIRPVRVFNPLARADSELFAALMSGDHALHGFTNRDLREKLAPPCCASIRIHKSEAEHAKLHRVSVLIDVMMVVSIIIMTRRVTANLPEDLLDQAMEVTGKGITDTLIEGLKRVRRSGAFEKAQRLRGKVTLKIDLEESRERDSR